MIEQQSYFGDYFVINEIACGGMATICRAYDTKNCCFVALKSLFDRYENDPVFLKRLQREGDIYRSLRHPNIIELISSSYEPPKPHLALEYIHGETLSGIIERNPSGCQFPAVFRIVDDILGALLQAHAKSIIHRDLQPQNVLVDGSGVVKLFDFGIAYAEDDLVRTMTGTIMGTILYSAPEQSEGKEVDERADLYSLGLVFYELLTGKRAYDGKDLGEVLEKKLRQKIVPPSTYRPDVSPFIDKMVVKLLNKNPDKRYRSIGNLMESLMDWRCTLSASDSVKYFGNRAEHALYSAKKYFAVGRSDDAIVSADEFATLYTGTPESRVDYLYLLARIYSRKMDTREAYVYYDKLLENKFARNDHLLDFALFLHRVGSLEDALDVLAVFTAKAPMGTSALAVRRVIKEAIKAKSQKKKRSVAAEILSDMDDFLDPEIIEPVSTASKDDRGPVFVEEVVGDSESQGADDEINKVEKTNQRGWRGAVKSWFSRAMNKKED
jgi:serine/threonine protein kinase